jgi:hypothetical protein
LDIDSPAGIISRAIPRASTNVYSWKIVFKSTPVASTALAARLKGGLAFHEREIDLHV